jgi:putative endonuclease
MFDRQRVGRRGEEIAAEHLRGKGYSVLERNVRTRYGEIDIVARDGDCIVFVEVRTVQSAAISPEESVHLRKQRQIAALAMRYLQKIGQEDADWRADVVAIEVDRDGRPRRVDHIISAVEAR